MEVALPIQRFHFFFFFFFKIFGLWNYGRRPGFLFLTNS